MRGAWVAWLVAAALLLARPAFADDARQREARARLLFDAGQVEYKAGRYEAAAQKYISAHELMPRQGFLWNIAQAYRLGGQKEKAVAYYKAFLAGNPRVANATEVREYIRSLEEELARPAPAPPPPAPPSPQEVAARAPAAPPEAVVARPSRPITRRWWFWTGVAAVTATVATVAIIGLTRGGGAPDTDLGTTKVFGGP